MGITGLLRFWHTYKNLSRIRQIVNVLLKHGFGQFIEQTNLQRFIPLSKRIKYFTHRQEMEKHTIPQRLRLAFGELGPSFIKLAQMLSTRPDLVTEEYANEFKKLQDRVPPFSSDKAVQMIESEFKVPLADVFVEFDMVPVAAASIAQVHTAVLNTGEKVIVKVQRPDIREMIETDIVILGAIARLMLKYIPESKYFDPQGIVDEFGKTVRRELDFIMEAKNAQRFRKNFEGHPDIYIPAVYPDFLSARVVVMEKIEGTKIDDIKAIDELGIDRRALARKGVDAYFKMIFEDGFFHADPHPGNIFVLKDGKIGLMDFGIVGWLSPEMIENIARAFLAVISKDFDRLIDIYINLGLVEDEVDLDRFKREFRADLVYMMEPLYDLSISEVNFPEYLEALTHLVIKHGLRVPTDLLLMNRTILIVDNIGRRLDPKFNLISAAEPYAAKLVKRRMSPQSILSKGINNITELGELVLDTPKQINRLLRKTLRDEVSFKMEIAGMDKLIRDLDKSSNRIAFSLIVASIILGSSMLIQSNIGGKIFGLPAVGAIGFLVAFVLGLRLLISIIRSGRL